MLALAVLPSLVLFYIVWKFDRYEKEPPKLLWALFGLGAATTVSAAIIELLFGDVILAGMDNSHRGSGMSKLAFDREEGLGLRAVDPENHLYEDGIITRMIREKEHESEVDELKRVFYVAVTRARETFYLLGASDFDR